MRAALIALSLLLGPGAVAASADKLSISGPGSQRVLVMTGTGTPGNSTVTVGAATTVGKAYRFTSTATIAIRGPVANEFCEPSGAAVECVDDPTPATPNDDIVEVRVDAGVGVDNITVLDQFSSARVALNGDKGADTITGGPGPETISAGDDDDTIEAYDGNADKIRCDAGLNDTVRADPIDTFPGDDCENKTIVTPPPPPPPPPPPFTDSGTETSGAPIAIGVSAAFEISRRGTRVRRLTVKDVPAGIVVRVTCTSPSKLRGGARCPFKRATIRVSSKTDKLALLKHFKRRRLARRTVIRIYGTAVGRLGTSVKFTIRKSDSPSRSDGCVNSALKSISCLSVNPG